MLNNIFQILSLQLMKGWTFEEFLVFKKKNVFIIIIVPYIYMTVNGAYPFEQTNLVTIGQVVSEY